jgi:hypothetical protein
VFYFRSRVATTAPGVGGISMSLKITNSEVDGVSVVELDGRIVSAAQHAIAPCCPQGHQATAPRHSQETSGDRNAGHLFPPR